MARLSKEERLKLQKDLGLRLRFERMKMGLSQEELAYRLNISDRQYRRYESGSCTFPPKYGAIIREMGGADLNFLYIGTLIEDTRFYVGLRTLPDERLEELYEKYHENLTFEEDDVPDLEPLKDVIIEIVKYGEEHWDPSIAKEGIEHLFLTNIYIEQGIEQIEANGLHWDFEFDCESI